MVEPVLKALISITAGIATLGCVVMVKPVEAAVITYDFTVDVTTGSYVGKYNGNFSYDDSQPLLATSNNLFYATPANHNLSIVFNFLGQTFTQQDERDLNMGYPNLYFSRTNNTDSIVGLSLLVLQPRSPVGFFILGQEFLVGNVEGVNPYAGTPVGTVSYTKRVVPDPIPSPSVSPPPTLPPSPPSPPVTVDPCEGGACAAVPEPSEIVGTGLAIGLLGLGWGIRRRIKGQ